MRSGDVDIAAVDPQFRFSVFGDSVVYGNRLDQTDTLKRFPLELSRKESQTVMERVFGH
jgi:hypothetical protein